MLRQNKIILRNDLPFDKWLQKQWYDPERPSKNPVAMHPVHENSHFGLQETTEKRRALKIYPSQ